MIGICILYIHTVITNSSGMFAILGANLKKEKLWITLYIRGNPALKERKAV